jgi:flagellin
MRINNNLMAMNTHRQLGINANNGSKSIEKLSSGFRINRAGDDAAGLAISEKMRGQIRGLGQASRNSQDAISLVQTAEGALNETQAILQRMRQLAVQSSSDTNTNEDRSNIQKEVDQLTEEIDKISTRTEFNTKKLLDGTLGSAVNAAVANEHTNTSVKGTAAALADSTLVGLTDKDGNSLGLAKGDTIKVSYIQGGSLVEETHTIATTTEDIADLAGSLASLSIGSGGNESLGATDGLVFTTATAGLTDAIHGLTVTVTDSNGDTKTNASSKLSGNRETVSAKDVRADGTATFQIGANQGQELNLSIERVSADQLGVKNLKIDKQGSASVGIKVIDAAITKISEERAKLGASQNRLEHTIKNLDTSAENLQASESRIRDVDMAKEMMNFTKNNILQQAAQAMLAQANQAPQGVLQLLR